MQSILIAFNNKEKRDSTIADICKKYAINQFDITHIEQELIDGKEKQTIGIGIVRKMQQKIFLAPFKSKTKAVILEEAHLLTAEAQNALLKLLEEPPNNTLIILSSETKEAFLPTILSRCFLFTQNDKENPIEIPTQLLKELLILPIGNRLKKAQETGKTKEQAVTFVKTLLFSTRNTLLTGEVEPKQLLLQMDLINKAYKIIKTTNANPRMTLENLLIHL